MVVLSSWLSVGVDVVWASASSEGSGLGELRLVFSGGLRKRLAIPVGIMPGCKPRNGVSRATTPRMRWPNWCDPNGFGFGCATQWVSSKVVTYA